MSPVWKIGEVMGPMGGNTARFMSQLSSIDFCPYISETIGPCLKSELDCYGDQNTTKLSNSCGVGDHPSAEQNPWPIWVAQICPPPLSSSTKFKSVLKSASCSSVTRRSTTNHPSILSLVLLQLQRQNYNMPEIIMTRSSNSKSGGGRTHLCNT